MKTPTKSKALDTLDKPAGTSLDNARHKAISKAMDNIKSVVHPLRHDGESDKDFLRRTKAIKY